MADPILLDRESRPVCVLPAFSTIKRKQRRPDRLIQNGADTPGNANVMFGGGSGAKSFYPRPQQRTPIPRISKKALARPPLTIYPDGREVLNLAGSNEARAEYGRRLYEMWKRQGYSCCLCFRPLMWRDATFEHSSTRGMGGAFRDDRIWNPRGLALNGAAHRMCNGRKGSRHQFSKFRPEGL